MKRRIETKDDFHRMRFRCRRKIVLFFLLCLAAFLILAGRTLWVCVFQSSYYTQKAKELHERERSIKAARGRILDRNGTVLAENKSVCTISVIHNQITDPEAVIACLHQELGLSEEFLRKRVTKLSSIERIRSNVDPAIGERIRQYGLAGIKVDEDYKRYYPYDTLASKVLGFTGGDNQGIIGLEVTYDDILTGENGLILATTDARGVELDGIGEGRVEPVPGNDLYLTMDRNIQMYAEQLAMQAMVQNRAKAVRIIVMDPNTGGILAMTEVPEFHLNDPFCYIGQDRIVDVEGNAVTYESLSVEEQQKYLNGMWRNGCINDTYEPGSTFKIITAAAALEEKLVTLEEQFFCPGYVMVEDRRIRCSKTNGHGSQNFVRGTMNSCNPVFVTLGLRLGPEKYYEYFCQYGLLHKTGIDLPGEAGTIMHNPENIGPVELATISFGQSFQISPIRLLATVSAVINGGYEITPHVAAYAVDSVTGEKTVFPFPQGKQIVSRDTSEKMKYILEQVVAEGTGKNGYVEGFRIGGKTATSQTIPRGNGKYIASYLGFAPADNPEVIAIAIIEEPSAGGFYGGQIAAPVIRQLFENILPYMGGMDYNVK